MHRHRFAGFNAGKKVSVLSKKEQELFNALEPRALTEGIEIVTVEVVGATKAPTIRVYIDTPNGVSFDELSTAQAWINDIMDELDPFPGAYMLEVSSPGIDRPLRTIEHFARFVGDTCVMKTHKIGTGRNSWTGVIRAAEGDKVTIEVDGELVEIPYESIKRAHIKGVVDFSS